MPFVGSGKTGIQPVNTGARISGQQNRNPHHPLFRDPGSPHQQAESRRITESGIDVFGPMARPELHARPGADGPKLRQLGEGSKRLPWISQDQV